VSLALVPELELGNQRNITLPLYLGAPVISR